MGQSHERLITSVAIGADGGVLVRPEDAPPYYDFVYRAGCGVRWDAQDGTLRVVDAGKWSGPESMLEAIAFATLGELGDRLVFGDSTTWDGIPSDLQHRLRAVLARERVAFSPPSSWRQAET